MKRVILIKYGELFLKGKNKSYFEKVLLNNIKYSLAEFGLQTNKISGRFVVSDYNENDENKIIDKLIKIFGIYSVSLAQVVSSTVSNIENLVATAACSLTGRTFRVSVKRADKKFPINSTAFSAQLGGVVLSNNDSLKVDLTNFDNEIFVEIREDKCTYVYHKNISGLGGMPVGTSGRGLLLLSGGIDSPVAGFLIAKRGMSLSAVHFHSYPYTNEHAKQKVLRLAKILSEYVGNIKIHVVSLTRIQEEINKHCREEYMITIMRRFMVKIAQKISERNKLQALITGESLGQVASQTVESITTTNLACDYFPILRPLISFDKLDIIKIAKNINTYETSIIPHEDCCTVFLPKNPIIKPIISKVLFEENKLEVDALVDSAMASIEIIETKNL